MASSSAVVLFAIAFVGSHIGLATQPVRSRLVARFGEWGFRWIFSGIAATSFALLVIWYADHRSEGPAGLALGTYPVLRWPLVSMVVLGIVLMAGSFARYGGGPYDLVDPGTSRPARGLERVTRHSFFVGVALFAGAHALLATHLVGALPMLALAVLAVAGARHQDAKLHQARGAPFAAYVASTSAVPFAGILAGRQRLVWRELPWGAFLVGVAVAGGLRSVHADIFAHRGAWVILVVVGGALTITAVSWARDRRRQPVPLRRPAPSP